MLYGVLTAFLRDGVNPVDLLGVMVSQILTDLSGSVMMEVKMYAYRNHINRKTYA